MSYLSDTNVPCEAIQDALDANFVACLNPVLDPMPLLETILATQNQVGITQKVSDNGKVKMVNLLYENRLLESAATNGSGARTCTATNQTYNNYTSYTIDPADYTTADEVFTIAELALVCEDPAVFLAKKIAKVVDVIERKIATNTATEMTGLFGEWSTTTSSILTVNGSDELQVASYVSTATKVLNYTMFPDIDLALQTTGFCSTPIIIGGAAMYQAAGFMAHGCCSTTGANVYDIFNEFGKAVMFDKRLATALGDQNKAVVFQPGSVALLRYNEYSTKLISGANYDKFIVNSPRTGLPIDIVISDNCGTISIIGYANTKLVGLPADMFAVGDEFRGVNFVNKIKIVNPA